MTKYSTKSIVIYLDASGNQKARSAAGGQTNPMISQITARPDQTQITKVSTRKVWLALGSNQKGKWGSPEDTIALAIAELARFGVVFHAVSALYITEPVGGGWQPRFYNAVACVTPALAAASLLRMLKRLERAAGRRLGRRWGPRVLDLDIIHAGYVVGRGTVGPRPAGRVILPHPEMHRRAFVLEPLTELAPGWWHPVLKRTARQLLSAPYLARQRHGIRRSADRLPVKF